MNPSFREILRLLNDYEVEYIVVGGVAAVIHGAPVTTFDLDALIRVSDENAKKLVGALDQLGARYRENQSIIRPTEKDIVAGGHLLLMTRAGPLDVLGYIGARDTYDSLKGSTIEVATESGAFRVLALDELVRQKKVTNRAKDRAVLDILEALLSRRD
ncbi:MAG: hypothetical protein AB8G17_20710 [Gammaproteobacteria bacterium]